MVEGYFHPAFVPERLSFLWFISLCCFFSPTYGLTVKKWSYKVWEKMTFFSDWGLNWSSCAQTWWRMNEPSLLKLTRHVVSSYWAFVGFFFNWRKIALQCVGFCCTTWISHNYIYIHLLHMCILCMYVYVYIYIHSLLNLLSFCPSTPLGCHRAQEWVPCVI